MVVEEKRWYLALEGNDTLNRRIRTLQTELFRDFGLVEPRLLPPLCFLYRIDGLQTQGPLDRATGELLLGRVKELISPGDMHIEPPRFTDGSLILPVAPLPALQPLSIKDTIRLEGSGQAGGFIILPGRNTLPAEQGAAVEERGRLHFPQESPLGKAGFVVIHLMQFQDDGSSWTIYPLATTTLLRPVSFAS